MERRRQRQFPPRGPDRRPNLPHARHHPPIDWALIIMGVMTGLLLQMLIRTAEPNLANSTPVSATILAAPCPAR